MSPYVPRPNTSVVDFVVWLLFDFFVSLFFVDLRSGELNSVGKKFFSSIFVLQQKEEENNSVL